MPQNRYADTHPSDSNGRNRVARTDSLRSERSDKRVSFNKDVGVKHIPRGAKGTSGGNSRVGKPLVPPPPVDEWAACSQVHREPVTQDRLAEEAENVVRLIDNVNCNSLDRTSRGRNNTNKNNFAHHTYNNVLFNNNRNNKVNGDVRSRPKLLPTPRTTNPISRKLKGDVNREGNQPTSRQHNNNPGEHFGQPRRRSADPIPESPTPDHHRQNNLHLFGHKSVPDLNSYLNNEPRTTYTAPRSPRPPHGGRQGKHTSVENLCHDRGGPMDLRYHKANHGYKSVENLAGNSPPPNRLHGFKSVGHLPSASYSDSDSGEERMSRLTTYRPKVGNIIRKFNQDIEDNRRPTLVPDLESGRRGTLEPDRFRNHNNNQPFSYTGVSPMAPMNTVRRLSPPPRDPKRPTPPRDSPSPELPVYAQVNKPRGRDMECNNYRNHSQMDAEYSAKIIITDDDYDDYGDHRLKDDYRDGDDDAYESYQVPQDNFEHLISGKLHEYKEHSNNNINMSSVGVQTEGLAKARMRSKTPQKSPVGSPTRMYGQQEKRSNTSSYHHHHHQSHHREQQHQQRNDKQFHNNLASASLVRQVNHGFGRTDRSPSPPPRTAASRQPRRNNVVPLLSDTSDSETEHTRRRTVDPLARIRDQVMQREKLQEEEEEEEGRYRRTGRSDRKDTSVMPYTEELTPLTIDEVDALSLVMDETGGKNSLVVSNQAQSSVSMTRVSNHRSRRTETVTEHVHHKHNESRTKEREREREREKERDREREREKERERERERDREREKNIKRESQSLPRPRKSSHERNQLSRDPTPPRRRSETPTRKEVDKNTKKNNLEKEKKDKKEKEQKKKKKRIKIKFFYDPRPQDEPDTDPLANFTEFRGDGNDSLADDRQERAPDERQHEHSPPPDSRDRRDDYLDSRDRDCDSERNDYDYERYDYDKYQRRSQERDQYHSHTDYREVKERHVGSRERLDYDDPKRRGSKDSRDSHTRDMGKTCSRDDLNHTRDDLDRPKDSLRASKDNLNLTRSRDDLERSRENLTRSRDNLRRSRENLDAYDNDPKERKNGYYDGDDDDDDDETRPTRTLSEKYRNYNETANTTTTATATMPAHLDHTNTEEDVRQQKIQRQRKKFFSALMSEGKANRGTNSNNNYKSNNKNKSTSSPPLPPSATTTNNNNNKQGPASWESSTLARAELRSRQVESARQGRVTPGGYSSLQRSPDRARQSGPPPSNKPRYFGDTDMESEHGGSRPGRGTSNRAPEYRGAPQSSPRAAPKLNPVGPGDYRSLPNRGTRKAGKRGGASGGRSGGWGRGRSPPGASGGSSLHSSESEVDSHGGSRASHVSTGSNRSVYLHATAVADIPGKRGGGGGGGTSGGDADDATTISPSERGARRESKKVSRSFSLLAPWKPRHYREKYEVEYDNREAERGGSGAKGALPPRPPRRPAPERTSGGGGGGSSSSRKVNRSQSVYKDSRLATWLRRRRNKEAKGI